MSQDKTARMIEKLGGLTVAQLRARYAEVFGEPTRSGNRQWLLRRVAWRIQALAEGDLSKRARRRARELARDADIRLRPPTDRGPALGTDVRTTTRQIASRLDERLPIPGSVLTRTFKGWEYRVTVLQDGFEYDSAIYRSLSAVAAAITGSHWNGYHFFGLSGPKKKQRKEPS